MEASETVVPTESFCVTLHPYISTKDDELALKTGYVTRVTKKADDGWWFGTLLQPSEMGEKEQSGWFPANFVLEPEDNNDALNKTGPLRYAKVVFDYKQREEDELNLKTGDLIIVIQSEEEKGWFKGISSGKFGLFPENFVTWISEDDYRNASSSTGGDKQGTAQRHPLINADAVKLKLNNPQTLQRTDVQNQLKRPNATERRQSLGNLMSPLSPSTNRADDPTDSSVESKQSNTFSDVTVKDPTKDDNYAPDPVPKSPRPPSTLLKPQKEKKVISQAMVLFRYTAKNPDELSLVKNSKLDIIEKDEDGWWTGIDDQGKIGVFPFNFVKEIATTSPNLPPSIAEETQKSLSRTLDSESKVSKRVSYYMQSASQNDLTQDSNFLSSSSKPKKNSNEAISNESTKNSELITPKPASSFRVQLPGMGFAKPQQESAVKSPSKNGLSDLITPEPQKREGKHDPNDLIVFSNNSLASSQQGSQDLKHVTKSRPAAPSSKKKSVEEPRKPPTVEETKLAVSKSASHDELKALSSNSSSMSREQPTVRLPDSDSLPPLSFPSYLPPGTSLSAEDVYKLLGAELFKLHAEMDVRLSKEREHRLRLERELQDLKRLLDRK